MYSSRKIAERIKYTAKAKGISVKNVLSACELNPNTLNQISDKKGLSSFSLAKIADCLECSVDYLLGRTDVSDISVSVDKHQSNVNRNYHESEQDELTAELLKGLKELTVVQKAKIMIMIDEMKRNN